MSKVQQIIGDVALSAHANLPNKNRKVYSEGLMAIYTTICTFQNNLLYGNACPIKLSKRRVVLRKGVAVVPSIRGDNILAKSAGLYISQPICGYELIHGAR